MILVSIVHRLCPIRCWLIAAAVLALTAPYARADGTAYVTSIDGGVIGIQTTGAAELTVGQTVSLQQGTEPPAQYRVLSVDGQRISLQALQNGKGTLRLGDTVTVKVVASAENTAVAAAPRATPMVTVQAVIIAIDGDHVIINKGTNDGFSRDVPLTVVRNGTRLAGVQLDVVGESTAAGRIIDQAAGQQTRLGDTVILQRAAAPGTSPQGASSGTGTSETPTPVVQPFAPATLSQVAQLPAIERPARSYYTVPRVDPTYANLGALSRAGLITKYPTRVFYDDTVIRHRTDDDLVFTRAEVADMLDGALHRIEGDGMHLKPGLIVVLQRLVKEYAPDLAALGWDTANLSFQLHIAQGDRKFPFSVSSEAQVVSTTQSGPKALGTVGPADGVALERRSSYVMDFSDRVHLRALTESLWQSGHSTSILRDGLLSIDRGNTQLEIGHGVHWWGPGHFGSLLLSDATSPYTYLQTRYRRGRMMYEGFAAPRLGDQRSLTGHRLEFAYNPNIKLGIAETVVASAGDSHWPYSISALAVPGLPFILIDRARHSDDNFLISLYSSADFPQGFQMYYEFLIDDFIIRARETAPNRTGYLFGAFFHDPRQADRANLRLEYMHVDNGVYVPTKLTDTYYYGADSFGYPLSPSPTDGIGYEDYRLEGQYKPMQKLTLGAGLEWTNIGLDRPVREKQTTQLIRLSYDLRHNLSFGIRHWVTYITNLGFAEGVWDTDRRTELFLNSFF